MADVKLLVQGVDQLRKGSLAILLATLGIGLPSAWWPSSAR